MTKIDSPYSAAFTGCSFMMYEMNRLLPLLMADNSEELLRHEIDANNVMMVDAAKSRSRYISELKRRFNSMPRHFWESYINFSEDAQRLAMLLVLMKTYRLVMDFHLNVTIKKWNSVDRRLTKDDIAFELNEISANDEFVASWSENTKNKIASAYLTFVSQAGLSDKKSGMLHRPCVTNEDYAYYLRIGQEWFLKACLLQPYEIEDIKKLISSEI